jgi:hypothetical protein
MATDMHKLGQLLMTAARAMQEVNRMIDEMSPEEWAEVRPVVGQSLQAHAHLMLKLAGITVQ